MTQTTVSICMIVLNEAELLPRALANWRELADELIIVDTGSTDRTVEIARAHGAQILTYDWPPPGHKGEARNMGLDAATGDWIVVLDADEVIQNLVGLRTFIRDYGTQYDVIDVRFQNYDEAGNVKLDWYQPRIFRRGQYRYRHREHELPWLISSETPDRRASLDVIFEHRPPPERADPKVGLMLERLKLDVEEHPDDPHARYFLHRQYLHAEQWQESIDAGQVYLQLLAQRGETGMVADLYCNFSVAFERMDKLQPAFDHMYLAISQEPRRRENWTRLASMYRHHRGDHNMAVTLLQAAMSLWPTPQRQTEPTMDAKIISMLNHSQQVVLNTYNQGARK